MPFCAMNKVPKILLCVPFQALKDPLHCCQCVLTSNAPLVQADGDSDSYLPMYVHPGSRGGSTTPFTAPEHNSQPHAPHHWHNVSTQWHTSPPDSQPVSRLHSVHGPDGGAAVLGGAARASPRQVAQLEETPGPTSPRRMGQQLNAGRQTKSSPMNAITNRSRKLAIDVSSAAPSALHSESMLSPAARADSFLMSMFKRKGAAASPGHGPEDLMVQPSHSSFINIGLPATTHRISTAGRVSLPNRTASVLEQAALLTGMVLPERVGPRRSQGSYGGAVLAAGPNCAGMDLQSGPPSGDGPILLLGPQGSMGPVHPSLLSQASSAVIDLTGLAAVTSRRASAEFGGKSRRTSAEFVGRSRRTSAEFGGYSKRASAEFASRRTSAEFWGKTRRTSAELASKSRRTSAELGGRPRSATGEFDSLPFWGKGQSNEQSLYLSEAGISSGGDNTRSTNGDAPSSSTLAEFRALMTHAGSVGDAPPVAQAAGRRRSLEQAAVVDDDYWQVSGGHRLAADSLPYCMLFVAGWIISQVWAMWPDCQ